MWLRFRSLLLLSSSFLSCILALEAGATTMLVSFSGTINGVSDNTGSLNGSNITGNGSTFTGTFTYDTTASAIVSSATAAIYPGGPLTVTIDGQYVFSAPGNNVRVYNDDANFHDRFESIPSGAPVTFPFAFNPNDNLFRVSFEDATSSVFSGTDLPTDIPLASVATRRELFIRTDLDRAAGQLWIVSGVVTSLSFSVVPEPSTALLLGLGLAAIAARRRSRASVC
jgi:hypothetical protein